MDQKGSQNVRTFAADVARAKSGGGTVSPNTKDAPTLGGGGAVTPDIPKAPTLQEKINAHSGDALRDTVATRASHLSDEGNLFDITGATKGTPEGTIVKDTKSKRWSLSREIEHSVSGWVKDKAEALAPDRKRSDVAPAALRAEVIATAGAKSHIAPQDDSRRVVQKLRTFAKDAERATGKPFKIATDIPEETPKWTSISDPDRGKKAEQGGGVSSVFRSLKQGRPVKTAPLQNRGNVIAKSADLAVAPKAAQTVPDSVFERDIEERTRHETPSQPKARYEPVIAHDSTIPAPVLRPAPVPEVALPKPVEKTPEPQSRDEAFEVPTFAEQKASSVRTFRSDAIEDVERKKLSVTRIAAAEAQKRTETNADIDLRPRISKFPLVVGTLGVVFAITAFGGVFVALNRTPAATPTDLIRIPSLVETTEQHAIPLGTDRTELLSTLASAGGAGDAGSLTQTYPTLEKDGKAVPATAGEIMSVLDIRAPGSFVRSLDSAIMFGSYAGAVRQPFIILKTNQFETAYAGMLEWEQSMSSDLAPLFGEPVSRTLDPLSRTNDQTRAARFIDDAIQNRDIRILYNELGEERILYSFVDQNTIVITTTPEAFVTILERLR